MGCSTGDRECYGDEKPAHQVTITKGFWLGQTEVTQAAWQRVVGTHPGSFEGANLPETVTWYEAQAYCQAVGGRLPTEAEWEYAARAGSSQSRYGDIDSIAWYSGNSGLHAHEVAQKQANAFGLYDTLGNVCYWTADWYGAYAPGSAVDPTGPASGQYRALRGGSWHNDPRFARVSYRDWSVPGYRSYFVGLRCAGE
jgi:formylglycine-generating enzyme required for sulfatase activity